MDAFYHVFVSPQLPQRYGAVFDNALAIGPLVVTPLTVPP
jgi:hypothetical protein